VFCYVWLLCCCAFVWWLAALIAPPTFRIWPMRAFSYFGHWISCLGPQFRVICLIVAVINCCSSDVLRCKLWLRRWDAKSNSWRSVCRQQSLHAEQANPPCFECCKADLDPDWLLLYGLIVWCWVVRGRNGKFGVPDEPDCCQDCWRTFITRYRCTSFVPFLKFIVSFVVSSILQLLITIWWVKIFRGAGC